jgi:hypothetical protein
MRGNDDSPSSALSAGLMDIGGIFHQPTQRKQTELIHEQDKTQQAVAGAPSPAARRRRRGSPGVRWAGSRMTVPSAAWTMA